MNWPTSADRAVGERKPDPQEEGIGHEDHEQEGPGQHEDDAQARFTIEKLSKKPASFSPARSRRGGKSLGTAHLILQSKGSLQVDGCPRFTHQREKITARAERTRSLPSPRL